MITGILNISTNDNSDKDRAAQTDVTVSSCAGSTGCTQVTYWPFTTQRDWTFIPCCFQTVQCGPVAVARGGGGGGGAGIVHRGLRHIHLKSSPHSLLTDTLNDGPPNNTEQISLWAQVLDDFGRPTAAPLSFSDTCT